MSDTHELRQIAQTIESNGGWHIAAIKVRAAADELDALAAENERLRNGGCARDQRTTQYCAEAVALAAQLKEARERVSALESMLQLIGNELSLHADKGRAGDAFRAMLNPRIDAKEPTT